METLSPLQITCTLAADLQFWTAVLTNDLAMLWLRGQELARKRGNVWK
jgi:hypothetical protein